MNRATWMLALLGLSLSGDGYADVVDPVSGMTFISVEKGCFKMGADAPQAPQPDYFWGRIGFPEDITGDERPRHEVCVRPFLIGKFEVSRQDRGAVTGVASDLAEGLLPALFSYNEAQDFLSRLNEKAGGKQRYRLPTEAEWEYACRGGGGKDVVPFADAAEGFAWYASVKMSVQPVGGLKPNALGIHDMLGNAWEWVEDAYLADGYKRHALNDPKIRPKRLGEGEYVLRGGSVRTEQVQTRCAMRGHAPADFRSDVTGLRVVLERGKGQ